MSADNTVEKKSRRRRGREEEELEEEDDDRSITQAKGRATPGKRDRVGKSDEGGFFLVRWWRGTRGYLAGVQDELDKVVWPTRDELIRLSRIVIIVTVAAALVLGAFSIAFTQLFSAGLENELVFVAFGAVVAVGYFVVTRFYLNGSGGSEPPY